MKQEKRYQVGERVWISTELYQQNSCIRPAEIISTVKEKGNTTYVTVRYLDEMDGKVYECVSINCIFRDGEVELNKLYK